MSEWSQARIIFNGLASIWVLGISGPRHFGNYWGSCNACCGTLEVWEQGRCNCTHTVCKDRNQEFSSFSPAPELLHPRGTTGKHQTVPTHVPADKQCGQPAERRIPVQNCEHFKMRVYTQPLGVFCWKWSELICSFPLTINNVQLCRHIVDLFLLEQLFDNLWSRIWVNDPKWEYLKTSQL